MLPFEKYVLSILDSDFTYRFKIVHRKTGAIFYRKIELRRKIDIFEKERIYQSICLLLPEYSVRGVTRRDEEHYYAPFKSNFLNKVRDVFLHNTVLVRD